ncbi:MAG: TonB-dependent receptor domain-containing protein, partial [Chitinophagaceae bacterium]
GSYKVAADYRNKLDGYVFNSKFNEKDWSGFIGMNKNWGYTHLTFSSFDQHTGLIEGLRDSATGNFLKMINNGGVEEERIAVRRDFLSNNPLFPNQRIKHIKIAADNSFRSGKNRIDMVLGYQNNKRKEYGNVLQPNEKNLFFDLGTVNYRMQYHFAEKKNFKATIGINGMQQTNKNKGKEQLIPEYSLFDLGAFIYTQKILNKITVSGGVRFDNRSLDSKELLDGSGIRFPAFNKNFTNVSGSAGISYEANKKVTLKFNLARGFRAPNISELASNGAHEGTNRYEYGEQSLKSENSFQADAGILISSEHLSFHCNVFYNSINNFIYYRKLLSVFGGDSLITNGTETFFAFHYDQDNAKLFGIEFNFDIHPHPLDWLHIENTFSWVRGLLSKEQDGSRNLPNIPSARLINELKVELFKKGKAIHNVFLKAELENNFSQQHPFTGYNTETATKGYSLLNAGFGGEVRKKDKVLFNIFIGATNITDVTYQSHLSRLKYAPENLKSRRTGVYNMGRNFSLKLYVPLDLGKQHK